MFFGWQCFLCLLAQVWYFLTYLSNHIFVLFVRCSFYLLKFHFLSLKSSLARVEKLHLWKITFSRGNEIFLDIKISQSLQPYNYFCAKITLIRSSVFTWAKNKLHTIVFVILLCYQPNHKVGGQRKLSLADDFFLFKFLLLWSWINDSLAT